jgi:hypothetical protein
MDQDFQGKLLAGERILWRGQPATGILLTGRDVFLIPFSIFWCGFAIFWTVLASRNGGAPALLFGLVFVTFGLTFMVGRFFIDAWLRRGTRYALTDRRVLILRTRPTADFTALQLDRLPQARLSQRRDGRGSIRFGPPTNPFAFGGAGFSIWTPSLDPTPQFLGIPDAAKVFDLVQRSQVAAG